MKDTSNLKKTIESIVDAKGAAIVSFEYNGKKRNGVIGYKPFGVRKWGEHTSAAIVTNNGEDFVTVKTNNEATPSGHAFKSFKLSEISNFTHKGITL
jgi:hypothetical protein